MLTTMAPALMLPSKLWAFLKTSPGRILACTVILVVAIVAAGTALVSTSSSHRNQLDLLIRATEPLSNASQTLYGSLSVADSTASIGFLQGGVGSAEDDSQYNRAIQTAAAALVQAGAGTEPTDSHVISLLTTINQRFSTYTGLIAQARTNNRLGNPVGAAYLTEASSIMQQELIPTAAQLYETTSARVREQEKSLTSPLWFPASGILAALIVLLLAQFWLAALTNRRLNAGLLVSTVAMAAALSWLAISSVTMMTTGTHAMQGSANPVYQLTSARIKVQQARTNEALALVRRSGNTSGTAFSDALADVESTLANLRSLSPDEQTAADKGLTALRAWEASHNEMVNRLAAGDYSGALAIAVGTSGATIVPRVDTDSSSDSPVNSAETNEAAASSAAAASESAQASAAESSTQASTSSDASESAQAQATATPTVADSEAQFNDLDSAVTTLIQSRRQHLRTYLADTHAATERITRIVLVLSTIAVVGVLLGMRPRMREYR